jgi:hypothetical protein
MATKRELELSVARMSGELKALWRIIALQAGANGPDEVGGSLVDVETVDDEDEGKGPRVGFR